MTLLKKTVKNLSGTDEVETISGLLKKTKKY